MPDRLYGRNRAESDPFSPLYLRCRMPHNRFSNPITYIYPLSAVDTLHEPGKPVYLGNTHRRFDSTNHRNLSRRRVNVPMGALSPLLLRISAQNHGALRPSCTFRTQNHGAIRFVPKTTAIGVIYRLYVDSLPLSIILYLIDGDRSASESVDKERL
jgi:hypothetical protein